MSKKLFLCFLLVLSAGCSVKETIDQAAYNSYVAELIVSRDALLLEKINQTKTITGSVIDEVTRLPVPGVEILDIGGQLMSQTDAAGSFTFSSPNKNSMFVVKKLGYEKRMVTLDMLGSENPTIDKIELYPALEGDVSFIFAGDTAFSRRMFNPLGDTPFDKIPSYDPNAIINARDPLPGTVKVLAHVKGLFKNLADYKVLNFESPLIEEEALPFFHPTKAYNFFSVKESLPALQTELDIDYVSMGNNHVYDYQELGLQNTLNALDEYGIANSGAGANSVLAYKPYEKVIGGKNFGLISASTVSGSQYGIDFMASDTKGGSADFRYKDGFVEAIDDLIDRDLIPLVQLHTGKEYTFRPTDFVRTQVEFAANAGSKIIIGHHPHVAQGFGIYNNIPIVYSLGNFILDQDRLETMFGLVAVVNYNDGIRHITAYPVYLEGYIPKLAVGHLANVFMRRIAEFSDDTVEVKINHGRLQVYFKGESIAKETRTISIPKEGLVDLRDYIKGTESLLSVNITGNTKIKIGRDLLNHGTHEDNDIDDDFFEIKRYDVSGDSKFACFKGARSGLQGLCSARGSNSQSSSTINFRNSIRVMGDALHVPNKDLTFLGYYKGENAGKIRIYVKYAASKDGRQFGEETLLSLSSLNNPEWQKLIYDLNMPAENPDFPSSLENNARALKFFLKHDQTPEKPGIAMYDDFAVISWDEEIDVLGSYTLKTPNAIEFLKIQNLDSVTGIELVLEK